MKKTLILHKTIACIMASLICATVLLMIGNGRVHPLLPPLFIFTLVVIALLSGIIFPVWWQFTEQGSRVKSKKMFEWIQTLIRFGIAFDVASFGWKKVFGLQFIVPDPIASIPMNKQNGEWLTWFYFGHSLAYGLIIAAIQIGGSFLLLFQKTRLLGAIILFPLMLNLSLINIFYQMNSGALWQAIPLTAGLLYLLLIEREKLVKFFFKIDSGQPPVSKPVLQTMTRFTLMALALLYTAYLWHLKQN